MPHSPPELEYLGFWLRRLASLIDTAIIAALIYPAVRNKPRARFESKP